MVRRLYAGSDEIVKRYVGGSLTHLVEWERRTRIDTIPFSTSRIDDSSIAIGEEVITQQGITGWTEYVWTAETINGVDTGNKTSELVGQFQAPRQQQVAMGTNFLKPGATGRIDWGSPGRTLYFFEWAKIPDRDKQYRITRYGPVVAGATILAVELRENGMARVGNTNAGGIGDGESFLVWGRNFEYVFSGGDLNKSLGLTLGGALSPESPNLKLIVEEV